MKRRSLAIVMGLFAALNLTPADAAVGDLIDHFILAEPVPEVLTSWPLEYGEEGVSKHTIDLTAITVASGFVEITYRAPSLPDPVPGELDAALDPALWAETWGRECTGYDNGDWSCYGSASQPEPLKTCRGEQLQKCRVGFFTERADCDDPFSISLFFGCDYTDYYWPTKIVFYMERGVDVEVWVHEAAPLYVPPPQPTVQEGAAVGYPTNSWGIDQQYAPCDEWIDVRPGTGFSLESTLGAAFNVHFIIDSEYLYLYHEVVSFVGAGDDWGTVPPDADRACVGLENQDDIGVSMYRYTDGLPSPATHTPIVRDEYWEPYGLI